MKCEYFFPGLSLMPRLVDIFSVQKDPDTTDTFFKLKCPKKMPQMFPKSEIGAAQPLPGVEDVGVPR